jgi:hypothetical protein
MPLPCRISSPRQTPFPKSTRPFFTHPEVIIPHFSLFLTPCLF